MKMHGLLVDMLVNINPDKVLKCPTKQDILWNATDIIANLQDIQSSILKIRISSNITGYGVFKLII